MLAGITDLLTAQHKNLNITILGTHAGLSKKPALTDIAVARIASLTILAPDTNRIKNAVIAGGLNPTPTYIRIHDGKPTDEEPFTIGKAYTLKDGTDCTLLCTGNTPTHALRAAELLSAEDLDCGVIHSPSIIPLDTDTITTAVRTSGCLVTIEEHNAATGFGSAVTNITSKYAPTPTRQVGADKTPLSPERIAEAAREAILQRCQAACVDLPQLMGDTQALQTPYEFHLYGGTSIHTLPGLQKALLTMSDSQFSHHCNAHKNDFSNWVAHAFNPRLGKQLANKRSRLAMATTLTRWLA